MAFSAKEAKDIRNPMCEPLWAGRRSLVHIDSDGVTIRDENADALDGFDDLRTALSKVSRAIDLVVDGYLVPGPLRSNPTDADVLGSDSMLTSTGITRQLFLGGGGRNKRKEAIELAEARRVELLPDEPTTFVAVDLLRLDGEALLGLPLQERRRLLESAIAEADLVRRSMSVRPPVETWYSQWKTLGIREFSVKDANSRYVPGDISPHWAAAPIPRR
jgi:ATP-dependent DNA ligase